MTVKDGWNELAIFFKMNEVKEFEELMEGKGTILRNE